MAANLILRQSQPLSDDVENQSPALTVIFEDDDLLVTQYIHSSRSAPDEEWHMFGAFGDKKPFGLKLAMTRNANATFYIPKKNVWYQTSSMEEIIGHAMRSAKRKHKTKVINYGSSMGGFAACAFAKFSQADLVISASPQISIDPSVVGTNDQRWADIGMGLQHKFPDARLGLENARRIAVIYDPLVPEDLWHAEQLKANANIELIAFEFAGHAVLHTIKDSGILRPLIESIIAGSDVSLHLEKHKQTTTQTFGYWEAVARRFMAQQNWGEAENCLHEALHRPGPTDQVYTLLGDISHQRNQLDEAARYALLAVNAAPNLAGLYAKAAQALDRIGKTAEAEALLNTCLTRLTDNQDACSILADFAFRRGEVEAAIAYMKRATMGRMGILPWHKVLGGLYIANGDTARGAQQLRLAQQNLEIPKPTVPPAYPMYQDGIHPISMGVRAERWSKTIKFNFLQLDGKSPCNGNWTIEASGVIAAEDFTEASVVKRDFYCTERSFEIIPGKAGYVSIDLPDSFIRGQALQVRVDEINNATISFVQDDSRYTPAFDMQTTYAHVPATLENKVSILAQRINSRLPALVKLNIIQNDDTLARQDIFRLEHHWIDKPCNAGPKQKFYSDPKAGIGAIQFLMHCEKSNEQELLDKILNWEAAPAPKLKYMVFFMPRSGSTLLCQLLAKSGIFGSAHELYIPSNYHPLYRLLDCTNTPEYIDRVERVFQSPHGVFGTEIDWDRYQIYWRYYLESRMDDYIKFYLDRKEFLSHFISQFYASVANVWFDINGAAQPERNVDEQLTEENISNVFSFLLRQKLSWNRYLQDRKDVKRIYYEDIMSRKNMEQIFADILPDATLWTQVQKEWKTYYDDTFFIPGSPKGKHSLREKIFDFMKSTTILTRCANGLSVAFPDFLEEYADDILDAAQRGIDLAPFVRTGPGAIWAYAE